MRSSFCQCDYWAEQKAQWRDLMNTGKASAVSIEEEQEAHFERMILHS